MSRDISNNQDVMDSRDVESRITELQDERKDLVDALDAAKDAATDAESEYALAESDDAVKDAGERVDETREALKEAREALDDWDTDNKDELDALEAFKADLEGYCPDWLHGTTLVRESYWTDYVQEMLEDCGDLPKNLPSYIVIDWDRTAENIQMDYTSGEFDGVTYWAR